ncbi:hypothetical protein G9C85_00790 [Halorubellus sp. JP-L1]|uniref:hypothetical protein n=1 Tax=Halorubellus sp. JP-L1 TaxID=2715753 RepID=UPI00140E75B8|nr:hypothetical protein [Halorubellus sp. JP-L1]NHN40171.1 hypothetical protein [Halorubellus sp. JP-L1]
MYGDDDESDAPAGSDDEWPDPPLDRERDPGRLRVRLACSAVVFLAFLALSGDYAFELIGMLWPPQSSLARWSTLVLLQALGYVVMPLLVGGLLGDLVYDHVLDR